jgi:hypothetical protein
MGNWVGMKRPNMAKIHQSYLWKKVEDWPPKLLPNFALRIFKMEKRKEGTERKEYSSKANDDVKMIYCIEVYL